jgi:hypothetical protein
MIMESKPKVFISHSWEDKKLVQRLEHELKAAGVDVWVDHDELKAGDSLPQQISNALDWCNILLLIWSQSAKSSKWVELEWTSAIALRKTIIPCIFDKTPVPAILRNLLFIDFRNFEYGYRALIKGIFQVASKPDESGISLPIRDRTKVFISYSHRDSAILDRIRVHLKPLIRDNNIEVWDDKKLIPGTKWREEIRKAVESARIAILLVSADFLASDFIMNDELPPLLAAAHKEHTIILSLIVGPCRFKQTESISQYQAMNDPLYPIIAMPEHDREKLYYDTTEYIEVALKKLEDIEE